MERFGRGRRCRRQRYRRRPCVLPKRQRANGRACRIRRPLSGDWCVWRGASKNRLPEHQFRRKRHARTQRLPPRNPRDWIPCLPRRSQRPPRDAARQRLHLGARRPAGGSRHCVVRRVGASERGCVALGILRSRRRCSLKFVGRRHHGLHRTDGSVRCLRSSHAVVLGRHRSGKQR